MLEACERTLPVDVAVCAAAVADWTVARRAASKLKKEDSGPPTLELAENPDILATLSRHPQHRPRLVVGFAAETESLLDNARSKLERKGCDWIVANDVGPETGTFGGSHNTVSLVTGEGVETWPELDKREVARRLVERISDAVRELTGT
jgi:phosphopantothenoylcysteine decarboxylase/phosphopantothenate--cysteine ligase